jgi:hypothetical protein
MESYPNTEAKIQAHAAGNVLLYIQSVGCTSKDLHSPRFQILPAQSVWNFMTQSVHSNKLLACAAQWKSKNYTQMHPLSRNWSNSDFLLDAAIAELVGELPNYLAIADGADQLKQKRGKWSGGLIMRWLFLVGQTAVVKNRLRSLLVQPISASAERVFSLLQNAFNR